MGRAPCCDKGSVKKGPWSPEEDRKLKEYMDKYGTGGNWIALPTKAGLKRCGKSCRLRWLNYLRPNIKHGDFSDYEDRIICNLFATIGSRWSIIAAQLPGRTDNDIKNYWNTKLKKKLMGHLPPPATHSHRSPTSKPPNHHHHHQLFFPAHPPILGVDTAAGTAAPQHHPFSLEQYSSSTSYGMFGGDQYQQQMSSCSDNGGRLYFELCNNSSSSANVSLGMESFIFGGLQEDHTTTLQSTTTKLFPDAHNMAHHQYGGGSSNNNNDIAASCYEHDAEMKPLLMIAPDGSGTSSFFYGEAVSGSQGNLY